MGDAPRSDPATLDAHQNAITLAEEITSRYAASLFYIAKGLAFGDGSDMVQSKHITEAELMLRKRQERGFKRELTVIVGSAMFGTFVQGAGAELLSKQGINPGLLAFYIAMGVAGLAMVVLTMRVQS